MLFVLSTGRAGSATIANALSQSPDMLCTHEPHPQLIEECGRYRNGDFDGGLLAESLAESRPETIDGRRYGESANRLSLAVPVLAATFPKAQFLWLVRDGREVVASGIQRRWYDESNTTLWERWRLRGDRLGEMSTEEWESWSVFRRNCWLWRRTNEIIRDDLAAIDPTRWRIVRLEELETAMGDVASFLDIEPVEWAVGRLNARSARRRAGDAVVNEVKERVGPESWTDNQHQEFRSECGPLMDELYPGWDGGVAEPVRWGAGARDNATSTVETSEAEPSQFDLAAVATELADLRVIRGEMKLLVEHVNRVDRRHRTAVTERDQAIAARVAAEREIRRVEAAEDRLAASLATLTEAARQGEADLTDARRRLEAVRASESYRIGHAIVRAMTVPQRTIGGLRRTARRRVLRVGRWAAGKPLLVRLVLMLPEPARSRLGGVVGARGVGSAGGTGRGARFPVHIPRLGLRAVVDASVDASEWSVGLDTCPPGAEAGDLTHVDLLLTADRPSKSMAELAGSHRDAVEVRTVGRVPPLPAGLTPLGFSREHSGHLLAVSTRDGGPRRVDSGLPGRSVSVRRAVDLPDPVRDPHGFRLEMQQHLALVDTAAQHTSPLRRARLLLCVSATGLPIVVNDPDELEGLVHADVLGTWTGFDPRLLTRELDRERISREQRSAVHDRYAAQALFHDLLVTADRPGIPSPSMSVVVASNRPEMVGHWSRQVACQDHPDFEVIWARHGDQFTDAHEAQARSHLGDRLQTVAVPEHHGLGDALNAATALAGGEVVVKWDDDDLYDPAHLRDLARARRYSGAELVGKAAEFVYLGGLDVTIRRIKNSTESYSTTISGPTLSIGRSDLREVGGWRRTRRRVDSLLIEDVLAAGGSAYRTSGFGFIMMRGAEAGHVHTWGVGDDYFVRSAIDQRPGLDLDFASVRCPDGLLDGSA